MMVSAGLIGLAEATGEPSERPSGSADAMTEASNRSRPLRPDP